MVYYSRPTNIRGRPGLSGLLGLTPNSQLHFFEDFTLDTAAPINNGVMPSGLVCVTSGTGVSTIPASTATERGVLQYSTGAGTTGSFGFTGGGGNNKFVLLQTSDMAYIGQRTSVSAVSTGGDTYTSIFGFSSSSVAVGTDAVLIQHDIAIDATHWLFTSRTGSVNTNSVSSVTITPNQYYILEALKLSGSDQWSFYIDRTLIGTVPTTTTATMCLVDYIIKSAGTTPITSKRDWLDWQIAQPNGRALSLIP